MWYPSREQQQQQYSRHGYIHHPSTQKYRTYTTSSYYCNDDELPTTSHATINGENESSIHCQIAYDGKQRESLKNFLSCVFSLSLALSRMILFHKDDED